VPCPIGYFNPNGGATDATACERCPENSINSAEGATSNASCTCQEGFRLDPNKDSCVCDAGFGLTRDGSVDRCVACPIGTFKSQTGNLPCADCERDRTTIAEGGVNISSCVCKHGSYLGTNQECQPCPSLAECASADTRIETMKLQPGAWRARPTTDIIRRCYTDHFCPNTDGSNRTDNMDGDSNTTDGSMCRSGHMGPFCEVCEEGYRRAAGGCVVCTSSFASALVWPITALVLLLSGVAFYCVRSHRRHRSDILTRLQEVLRTESIDAISALEAMDGAGEDRDSADGIRTGGAAAAETNGHSSKRGSVLVKARICISLVQVLNGIGMSFNIRWPSFFAQLLKWLSSIELDLPSILPLGCIVHVDFHTSLVAQTALPLVLVCLLWLVSKALAGVDYIQGGEREELRLSAKRKAAASERLSSREVAAVDISRAARYRQYCNDTIFLILFLVYPGAVAKIFGAFQCIPVPEAGPFVSYLRADFSIDCGMAHNRMMQFVYALPMMVVYPFGVPMLLGVVLWRHRVRLLHWSDEEACADANSLLLRVGKRDPRPPGERYAYAEPPSAPGPISQVCTLTAHLYAQQVHRLRSARARAP
jgi:hypothetical protein